MPDIAPRDAPPLPGHDFAGLVALVTGGASGIGAATVRTLRERGATVAILDQAASDEEGALSIVADLSDGPGVAVAVEEVVRRAGRLDILVNNAGIGAAGSIADNDADEWRRVLDVNLLGTVRVTRAALPHLRRSPAAAIVMTGSAVGAVGFPQRALYSATKGALESLTRAMAADLVRDGVRVNAVAPGTAATPWIGRLLDSADDPAAAEAALVARQPIGRLVTPEEVAFGIAYLASPLAGSTTGTVLPIDGGIHSVRV